MQAANKVTIFKRLTSSASPHRSASSNLPAGCGCFATQLINQIKLNLPGSDSTISVDLLQK